MGFFAKLKKQNNKEMKELVDMLSSTARIHVDEGVSESIYIYIELKFAMYLSVGDLILFTDEPHESENWIIDCPQIDELKGWSARITERIISSNELNFYAKKE